MPLYDFACRSCEEQFEARSSADETPDCPACGSRNTQRLVTRFAGPFTVGLRGAAARRSNANRSAREEQRRERVQTRKQQEK